MEEGTERQGRDDHLKWVKVQQSARSPHPTQKVPACSRPVFALLIRYETASRPPIVSDSPSRFHSKVIVERR